MSYEKQVRDLMDDARELVAKLHDTKNPDLQRMRDRVAAFIAGPKRIESSPEKQHRVKITRLPGSVLDYVHDHPWLALVTAASLAWTLGHVSSASRDQNT